MDTAHRFAELSSAKKLKVGAVVVKDNRIISIGYNGTPPEWDNVCEDENNMTKGEVSHAEENCITKLASGTESAQDSVMFITHAPCINCSKLIAGSGIKKVYFREFYRDDSGVKYLEKRGVEINRICH